MIKILLYSVFYLEIICSLNSYDTITEYPTSIWYTRKGELKRFMFIVKPFFSTRLLQLDHCL